MKFDITGMGTAHRARRKHVLAGAAISLVALGATAIAFAAPPHTWNDGDTLTAADLNGNLSALDTRIAALEAKAPAYLVSESTAMEHSEVGNDLVLQGASLELTPGTWLVEGFASVSTNFNPDQVQIGLWDDGKSIELPKSRSAAATTLVYAGGVTCDEVTQFCTSVALTTKVVVKVDTNTTIRIKGYRNGGSELWFGTVDKNVVLPQPQRLTALQFQ
jgi:hypothetical protein